MPLDNVYDGVFLLSTFGQAIRPDPVAPVLSEIPDLAGALERLAGLLSA